MKISSDLASGLILTLLGLGVAIYSYSNYELGAFSRMGPGSFPLLLGLLLAFIGALIFLIGLSSTAEENSVRQIAFRPLVAVCASILVFSLTLETLGLFLATVLLTLLCSAAKKQFFIGRSLLIGSCLAGMSWLIFVVGLDMSISLFVVPD